MMRYGILFVVLLSLSACSTVPITGRSQLNLIPGSSMMSMSLQQYDKFLKEHKVSTQQEQTAGQAGRRPNTSDAVERYFAASGLSGHLKDYKWEFNLVEDKQVNAWCMPGGKVVVYTGLLPVTRDDAGLAVVMGHEIAHAIAEHGNERMSQGLLAQLGGVALSTALSTQTAADPAALDVRLRCRRPVRGDHCPMAGCRRAKPTSLGLIFMAMAGYDPNVAIAFWQRMAAQKGGKAPPEFLSTHPSDATRIENIRRLIPEAMQYYKK